NAYDFSLNGGGTDFASPYASVSSAVTSRQFTSLTQDEEICFAVRAAWVDGTNFLQDTQSPIKEKCATPGLTPPVFDGVISVAKDAGDPSGSITAQWNAGTGIFDQYRVYLGDTDAKA